MAIHKFALIFAATLLSFSAQAETLQAHIQGRISAWVTPDSSLTVKYNEDGHGRLRLCDDAMRDRGEIFVVFVIGPSDRQNVLVQKLRINCTTGYPGNPNSATFSLKQADDPKLWDSLFPPNESGERWYALQLAFYQRVSGWPDAWDSNFSQNYRLILR